MIVRRAIAISFVLALLGSARPARAMSHELQLGAGPSTYASTWRGDFGGGGTLSLGWRMAGVVALDFQAWESLATVDARMNTGLSLGVRGFLPLRTVHPYARLFVIHQHEEGFVSVENAPIGVVAGIGTGIRHRAGAGGSLGIEVPVRREGTRSTFTLFSQVNGTYFGNRLGPAGYLGLDIGMGWDFLL